MSFFSNDSHPSSDSCKMSLGEMFHLMNEGELQIPDYQREYVWTKKQQERYLDSLSKNMPLFGPVINVDTSTGSQWIMDGQNRIVTIFKFLSGDINYKGVYFSKMPDNEKRRFKNMRISYTETRDWSREQCQDFFMRIQEGVKLKDGELIHARSDNELTKAIFHILEYFDPLLKNKSIDGGFGFSANDILRYSHFEIVGTLIHMVRTNEYPSRPGKTAKQECDIWEDPNTPTQSQREDSITETKLLLHKYSQLIANVAKLKDGIKKTDHLRLLYFFYKSGIYKEEMNNVIYDKIENLLNAVLNRDNAVFTEIKVLSGYNEEGIYDKYFTVYHM